MCAKDNFYFWGAISRKTRWKYAVRTVNHGVGLRTGKSALVLNTYQKYPFCL